MAFRHEKQPKLKLPYCPVAREVGHKYEVNTYEYKTVCDYTGFNMREIFGLGFVEFYALLRDAFITEMERTSAGVEYLKKCWVNQQTKADREGLRKIMKK